MRSLYDIHRPKLKTIERKSFSNWKLYKKKFYDVSSKFTKLQRWKHWKSKFTLLLQNLNININVKCLINAIETAMQRIRKNLLFKKKTKIKVTNDFIANKEIMNAKAFEKNGNNVQSILYYCVMNELFKNNH